jgi:hypothetical protein
VGQVKIMVQYLDNNVEAFDNAATYDASQPGAFIVLEQQAGNTTSASGLIVPQAQAKRTLIPWHRVSFITIE